MIKCKEDLIGKVIKIDNKKDAEFVTGICEGFGIRLGDWQGCCYVPFKSVAAKISHDHGNAYSCKLVFSDCFSEKNGTSDEFINLDELTISDLKPRTRTEYEKVTESIFDLRDEFERGELYFDRDRCTGGIYASSVKYQKIRDMNDFNQAALNNNIYRNVEVEIDWRDESHRYLADKTGFHWSVPIAEVINDESDCFLELCRVALRANGEIE